ncbi:unnamed protein product [Didymodactylos carnosus]|uniref:Uncharacterized protein n=1 Tax=Didymodactylos carnosus TaxID=1234261 RepID=A0A813PPG2_9BILA|nr:unnamed protein product [Didymodactylos carnosus]CAF3533951.1 unnamed protein product [Didymodactylos carnosus]
MTSTVTEESTSENISSTVDKPDPAADEAADSTKSTDSVPKEVNNSIQQTQLEPDLSLPFFSTKRTYDHPYGPWRPVPEKTPNKRTVGDTLDLPHENWHLPSNQPEPVIEVKPEQKVIFKEREIKTSDSAAKTSTNIEFKKRKVAQNQNLRGRRTKDD